MVYSLIPNRDHLQSHLERLCEVCQADEIVLFERATFLVISNAVRKQHTDVHRFEKVPGPHPQPNPYPDASTDVHHF